MEWPAFWRWAGPKKKTTSISFFLAYSRSADSKERCLALQREKGEENETKTEKEKESESILNAFEREGWGFSSTTIFLFTEIGGITSFASTLNRLWKPPQFQPFSVDLGANDTSQPASHWKLKTIFQRPDTRQHLMPQFANETCFCLPGSNRKTPARLLVCKALAVTIRCCQHLRNTLF